MTGRNELISPCQTRLLKTFSLTTPKADVANINTIKTTPAQLSLPPQHTVQIQSKPNQTKVKPIKRDAVDCLIVEAETIDSITWPTKNSWGKKRETQLDNINMRRQ